MNSKNRIFFDRSKLKHFFVLIMMYLVGLILVYLTRPSYMVNILIVYLPGFIYSFLLLKNSRRKIILFGLISIFFIIPVEILARLTDSWDVLSEYPRILGVAPVENIVYALVNILYPIAFYEYFYDEDANPEISSNWKFLVTGFLALFISVFSIYFYDVNLLRIDYWMIGLLIYIPVFILLFRFKPYILPRLLILGLVFGLMFGIHEILSMYLGHWWWPGEYLLPMEFYGYVYPLDDLVIWLLFSNVAVISGYEVMWD